MKAIALRLIAAILQARSSGTSCLFAGFVGFFVLLLSPLLGFGQSQFDGTWKIDASTLQVPQKKDSYLLQSGMFECKACVPPFKIRADGTDQATPDGNTASLRIVDDHHVEEIRKKDGKVVGSAKVAISPDGNSMTVNWTDSSQPGSGPQTGTLTAKRIAAAPAGTHLVSGSWLEENEKASEDQEQWTFKVHDGEITMTEPDGQTYTAKLDGTEAPVKGTPDAKSVSVRLLGKNKLQETFKSDGKVVQVNTITVSTDGKALYWTGEYKMQGRTAKFVARKL
jgi:hypothetical protein